MIGLQAVLQGSGSRFSAVAAHGCTGCKFGGVGYVCACERSKTEVKSSNCNVFGSGLRTCVIGPGCVRRDANVIVVRQA